MNMHYFHHFEKKEVGGQQCQMMRVSGMKAVKRSEAQGIERPGGSQTLYDLLQ